MDIDDIPDFLTMYRRFSDRSEPPQLFKDWAGVCAVASALGRDSWMDWAEPLYPNHWVVLVGPGGCRKGTAMAPVKFLLESIGIPLAADSITRERLFVDLCSNDYQRLPQAKHHSDPSTLFSVITILSEEFTSFTGTHDNTQFLTDLCRLYECPKRWVYKTKNSGSSPMEGVCLNLFAGTTPKNIITALPTEAIGSGFSSRIMFVYADRKSQLVDNPAWNDEEKALFDKLVTVLTDISKLKGQFEPTKGWWAAYTSVYHEQEMHPPLTDPRFESYLCRRQAHLIKLSMVMSASARNDMKLTSGDFQRAHELIVRTEESMERVFQGFGKNPVGDIRYLVAEKVRVLREVSFYELYNIVSDDATLEDFKNALAVLQGIKYLEIKPDHAGTIWIRHTPKAAEDFRVKMSAAKVQVLKEVEDEQSSTTSQDK